jgi:anti-sigma regulatory factor (Ser/Thr protein kinase)
MPTSTVLWSHETQLTPVTLSASEARDFVCLHLAEHQLLYLVEDVRLVASELVTNAVMHARTPLTVMLQELPFCVMLTVRDDCPSSPVPGIADVGDTGGRGLDVIEQFSNAWGVTAEAERGKSVWASVATRRRPDRSVGCCVDGPAPTLRRAAQPGANDA